MGSSEKFWLSIFSSGFIAVTIITCAGLEYQDSKNEKILRADTCIEAVLIEGDGYGRLLAICGLIKS